MPDGVANVAPLAPTQQLLYFFERAAPGTSAYRIEHVFRISGALDEAVLQEALDLVANRHDSLRAEFSEDIPPGAESYGFLGVVQRYVEAVQVPLVVTEGSRDDVPAWLENVLATRIPLQRAPLLSVHLLKLAPDEAILVLLAHHCVWDGWSAGIFLAELGEAMDARSSQGRWEPAAAPSYANYARGRHAELTPGWLREHLDWWKSRFVGSSQAAGLPRDRDYPSKQSYEAGTLWFDVPREVGGVLYQLARDFRATPFMLLSAGFVVFLRRYVGADVVWGTAFGNRDGEGLERAIGDFATALPLRVDLSDDLPFRKVVSQVRGAVLETLPHQSTPFHKLVPAIQGGSQSRRHPLFQVLLQYDREGPGHRFSLGSVVAQELPVDSLSCTLDLGVRMWETYGVDSFSGRMEYRRDLFDPRTVERFSAEFLEVLERVAKHPNARISELLDLKIE